jgi:hypothetical protein
VGLGALAHGQGLVQVHLTDMADQAGDTPAGTAQHRRGRAGRHDGAQAGDVGSETVEEPGMLHARQSSICSGLVPSPQPATMPPAMRAGTDSETVQTNPGVARRACRQPGERSWSAPDGPATPVTALGALDIREPSISAPGATYTVPNEPAEGRNVLRIWTSNSGRVRHEACRLSTR